MATLEETVAALLDTTTALVDSVQTKFVQLDATLDAAIAAIESSAQAAVDAAAQSALEALGASAFATEILDDLNAAEVRTTIVAQADLGLASPTIGDAGKALVVNDAGVLAYDPGLVHGAHLANLSYGL